MATGVELTAPPRGTCSAPVRREDHYLAVSAFAPYKRLDLAILACNRLRRSLRIIGTGHFEDESGGQ